MLDRLKSLVGAGKSSSEDLEAERRKLLEEVPAPLFWMLGKAQSGKTSIVRVLTGATDAEIGQGYRPTTKSARRFDFPDSESPLLRFLDTRGLGEAGYDGAEDVAEFARQAQVVVAAVRLMDSAQQPLIAALKKIRSLRPDVPVLLAFTCLHEAYPQRPHPHPDPFEESTSSVSTIERSGETTHALYQVSKLVATQLAGFQNLYDRYSVIDFTRPEDGFDPPSFGERRFKNAILEMLPQAYRQSILSLAESLAQLRDGMERHSQPYILASASMAAVAGAAPMPWVDLPAVAAIQGRLVYKLAEVYGQKSGARAFFELAGAVGAGMVARQAIRNLLKVIPGIGMAAGAAIAYGSTYALGKACCWYFASIRNGHVPTTAEIQQVYQEQISAAESVWRASKDGAPTTKSRIV